MSEGLRDEGLSSFRIDFAGNGRSDGDFYFSKFEREVEDLRCAIDKMRELGQEVVGIVGKFGRGQVLLCRCCNSAVA